MECKQHEETSADPGTLLGTNSLYSGPAELFCISLRHEKHPHTQEARRATLVTFGYEAMVPGNNARFFDSSEEARQQSTGWVAVSSRDEDPYLFNSRFDKSIIRHDGSYCSSVVDLQRSVQVPTMAYFERLVLPHVDKPPRIVAIGCGQAEFVDALTQLGVQAVGYDPVLRREAAHLRKRYWNPEEPSADLCVMRCVLPHVQHP